MIANRPENGSVNEEFSISAEGGSMSMTFLRDKCERISTVLYLLSSKIPDREPLKVNVREHALALVLAARPGAEDRATTMTLGNDGTPSRRSFAVRFRGIAADLATLLNISVYGGYLSKMNAEIITKELAALSSFVRTTEEEDLVAGEANVATYFAGTQGTPPPVADKGQSGGVVKDNTPERIRISRSNETGTELRRRLIIGIIKSRGVVSIKDVSSRIKDCSEKTIQRELVALVENGTLVREGSRRWSVYKLASGGSAIPASSPIDTASSEASVEVAEGESGEV